MTLLIVIIALALIFDYINGFHDAANSIATVVSTKVLTPFRLFYGRLYLMLLPFGSSKIMQLQIQLAKRFTRTSLHYP